MNTQPTDGRREPDQAIEFSETVCSPEFPDGCIDPVDEAADEPAPADTNAAPEKPDICFSEKVCSAEFHDGCVEPLKDGK
jgi:hypothetical protein